MPNERADVLPEDWKCWLIDAYAYCDVRAKVFALSRGRARYVAALSLREAGYANTIIEALKNMKCTRAPEYDIEAQCCGKEAVR